MVETTMNLLEKALATKKAAEWCEALAIDKSTLSNAKKRGHLSPALAGNFAMDLGEDATKWIAIAAIESERESALSARLRKSGVLQKPWVTLR